MHQFQTTILKYGSKGEKTGWRYIVIPKDILAKLKRKDKKSFRIKGFFDDMKIEKVSAVPVGEGEFIVAINGDMRKQLRKNEGAMLSVKFEVDESSGLFSQELMDCLNEDKEALKQFLSQLKSHQNYFHRYIETAKTASTKASRIVNTINAMHRKQNFGEMLRSLKK